MKYVDTPGIIESSSNRFFSESQNHSILSYPLWPGFGAGLIRGSSIIWSARHDALCIHAGRLQEMVGPCRALLPVDASGSVESPALPSREKGRLFSGTDDSRGAHFFAWCRFIEQHTRNLKLNTPSYPDSIRWGLQKSNFVAEHQSELNSENPDRLERISTDTDKHVHHKNCLLQNPTWNVSFGNVSGLESQSARTMANCRINAVQ